VLSLGFKDIRTYCWRTTTRSTSATQVRWQAATGAAVHASAQDIPYITGAKPRHSFKKYVGKLMRMPVPQNLRPFEEKSGCSWYSCNIHARPYTQGTYASYTKMCCSRETCRKTKNGH
jgi:hypothetical protein